MTTDMIGEKAAVTPALAHLTEFSPDSRVWVYVCNRALSDSEAAYAQERLRAFAHQWTSHNQELPATGEVFGNRVLLLTADETKTSAGGCSIDTSVHFLENLGREMGVDFFERMAFFYLDAEGQMQSADKQAFTEAVNKGDITADSLVLNTLIQRKKEFESNWWVPFNKSWHKRLF